MRLASAAGLLAAFILPAGCAEPAVKVTNLAKLGSVSVSNSGPAIQVKRRIVIEQQSAELRQHLDTAFVRDENVRERRVAMNG